MAFKTVSNIPKDSFLNKPPALFDLNDYVRQQLHPLADAHQECEEALDMIVDYLKKKVPLKVRRVLKSGAHLRGADVRGEVEEYQLVLFLYDFKSMADCRYKLNEILQQVEFHMKKTNWIVDGNLLMEKNTEFSVRFTLRCSDHRDKFHRILIFPCHDVLKGDNPTKLYKDSMYKDMKTLDEAGRQVYWPVVSQLQTKFIQFRPPAHAVNNLIRLVKHWIHTCFREETKKNLPNAYVIELLVLNIWERVGAPPSFDMLIGFYGFLRKLMMPQMTQAIWNQNYDFSKYEQFTPKNTRIPFIIDPASPFGNLAARYIKGWDDLITVARESLRKPLLWGMEEKRLWQVNPPDEPEDDKEDDKGKENKKKNDKDKKKKK
ncbi:unnamed protein product [Owenia fusiformis]|uniref:Uncharacterized protein n=1 Tax=Owenia fusiformis TaxID=6347 RepID=A0A8J1U4C7_OWEFU|nr:unnamed protein product [Owenia fusiformis]